MVDFFILGNPRSGTTLLRLLLNAHSEIIVPPECGFAVWLKKYSDLRPFQINKFVDALFETRKFDSWQLNKNEVIDYLKENQIEDIDKAISGVYSLFATKIKPNVKAIGDKNNFYISHVELLHEMYPNAKFIHIVRDGRDVACSYRSLMEKTFQSRFAPKLETDIAKIAKEWRDNNEQLSDSLSTLSSISVRLEDISSATEITMSKVCNFLNFEYEETMLDFYKTDQKSGMEPAEFDEWKSKNKQPLKDERYLYKKQLSTQQISKFNLVAGDTLCKFGYEV
ncbi:sulfotransferase family protein [Paraglaciecola sp.]|uniref:sulfotransferase family protein n=1 Tax=Paraglaciecola sp. TaxID=1920173 RepID=UPI003EF16550